MRALKRLGHVSTTDHGVITACCRVQVVVEGTTLGPALHRHKRLGGPLVQEAPPAPLTVPARPAYPQQAAPEVPAKEVRSPKKLM